MNKSELVDRVRDAVGLERRQAEAAVNATLQAVMDDVQAGNKVSISGFGIFNPTARAARTGRNPQTGAPVKIAASKGVRFAPSSAFKAQLNPVGKKAGGSRAAAKEAPGKQAPGKTGPARKAGGAGKATKAAATKAATTKAAKTTKAATTKAAKTTKAATTKAAKTAKKR